MEDAATAEISRSQIWQWIYQDTVTEEGTEITTDLIERYIAEIDWEAGPESRFEDAIEVFREVALQDEFPTFLTIPAYANYLVDPAPEREKVPA